MTPWAFRREDPNELPQTSDSGRAWTKLDMVESSPKTSFLCLSHEFASKLFFTLFILSWLFFFITSGRNAPLKNETDVMELVECIMPLGGGYVPPGGLLPQPQAIEQKCVDFRAQYFQKNGQYYKDTETAIKMGEVVFKYYLNYTQMVVFDIDATVLANIPFYGKYGYQQVTGDIQNKWQKSRAAPAIPAALAYYKSLREKGFSVAFITGRHEPMREATVENLEEAGFGTQCTKHPPPAGEICYEALILRKEDDDRDATIYKGKARRHLERKGFTIIAGVGDQWSDLFGIYRSPVVIKMPNPTYFIL